MRGQFRAEYLDDLRALLASDYYMAENLSDAVAQARDRAPSGAVELVVRLDPSGTANSVGLWQGPVHMREEARA